MTVWLILRDICFVLAALIYGAAVAAGTLYYARFRSAAKAGMAGRRKGKGRDADFEWIGALPLHSWAGSLAVALLLVPLLGSTVARFSQGPVWYGLPFFLSGEIMLLVSLWSVIRYEFRLIR